MDLNRAIKLAEIAHEGQLDKGGKPYIEHCIRVMNNVNTVEEKIVAVLHDVFEDTPYPLKYLLAQGYSIEIYNALDAITKRKCEPYNNYILRIINNKLALIVKLADMEDNMNLTRINNPTEKDYIRLRKYEYYYQILRECSKLYI